MTTALTGKKNKKSMNGNGNGIGNGEDSETESREPKKARTNFGAVRK